MTPMVLEDCMTLGDERAWCVLSRCEEYRYLLGRMWDRSLPMMGVTMLNPSKAMHDRSDRTVDKCVLIAKQEGFGGLLVRNLSAYRSTDPEGLLEPSDPIGHLNLWVLKCELLEVRVGAWGRIPAKIASRLTPTLFGAIRRCTHVFQWTDRPPRVPRHPLYLRNETRLIDRRMVNDKDTVSGQAG
jgi:hypothetical protein